jgi:hypothetical protein
VTGKARRGGGETPRRRRAIDPNERLKVWVRSGGVCAICGKYLLEGEITGREMTLGELAHMVGQQETSRSPRGLSDMPAEERDSADNLMLVCEDQHEELDRRRNEGLLTVEWLRGVKEAHEGWIRQLVGLQRSHRTAILRVVGDVRGQSVELAHETAGAAVVRNDARYQDFSLSYGNRGIEIDLTGIPGEADSTETFWRASREKIDQLIDQKLVEAVRGGHVTHVSVFGFARLPLLVYAGSKLDDTYEVSIYQRRHADGSWDWRDSDPVAFAAEVADTRAGEAVLILNVSGTVDEREIPAALRELPRLRVTPVDAVPAEDLIASRASLDAFHATVRSLLSALEVPAKVVGRLHVLAALPVSAATALGRLHRAGVDPALVLYDRSDGQYTAVLEIT